MCCVGHVVLTRYPMCAVAESAGWEHDAATQLLKVTLMVTSYQVTLNLPV